jgi:hypothetical protein
MKTDLHLGEHPSGAGVIEQRSGETVLKLADAATEVYSNAQLDDYLRRDQRPRYRWQPPLRMRVRARAGTTHPGGEIKGTAGFGFWNNPTGIGGDGLRLPRAVWFFYSSPPSNMALAQGVPGPGWKAATFDAARPLFYALLPLALPGFAVMRVPALYRRLWPIGQRALGVSEAMLPFDFADDTWHTYTLDWREDCVDFYVDGTHLHRSPHSPRGPLGFVVWLDNQAAVVTPQGRFGTGRVGFAGEQWLALETAHVEAI